MLPVQHVVPALVICISLLLASATGHTDRQEIPFTTLAQGDQSGIHDPRRVVIRDQAAWQALLTAMRPSRSAVETLPAVDFNSHMVIGIFLGMRRSGGYSVRIDRVVRDPIHDTITVQATETIPPPGAMTSQVLTYPYHLVRMPASRDAVKFLLAVP